MSHFSELLSVDSKLDTISKSYKDFKKLNDVKSPNENIRQKKITVPKNASLVYDELIDIYKKEYDQVFKSKDNDWNLKHDLKNLKNLDYQPDQLQQPHQPQQRDQPQQAITKCVKLIKSTFD